MIEVEAKRAKMAPSLTTCEPEMQPNSTPSMMKLKVKLLSENATAPQRASVLAAGYDIYSSADAVIPARGKGCVPTDISLAIPLGHYGRVAPRSGLAVKHSIDIGAGVIDADYRGPLSLVLFNLGDSDFQIKKGDRIAQLILEKISTLDVEVVDDLDETVRGCGGFGSTGVSDKLAQKS